jgi:hypothetical protein
MFSRRLAYQIRDDLAFSKGELGYCDMEVMELEWRNPT